MSGGNQLNVRMARRAQKPQRQGEQRQAQHGKARGGLSRMVQATLMQVVWGGDDAVLMQTMSRDGSTARGTNSTAQGWCRWLSIGGKVSSSGSAWQGSQLVVEYNIGMGSSSLLRDQQTRRWGGGW
ncbi:hypothetical protein ACJRO7_003503 [Eucalyptus globulus]|uniref:Uncharacterized protein n=1 Tax=Eucalyptus globulus TaxID=34317 RepID=A0ABD3IUS0_EUCGL